MKILSFNNFYPLYACPDSEYVQKDVRTGKLPIQIMSKRENGRFRFIKWASQQEKLTYCK